jgi:hypothetical protein
MENMVAPWKGSFDLKTADMALQRGVKLARQAKLKYSKVVLRGPPKLRLPVQVMRKPLTRPISDQYLTPVPAFFSCKASPEHIDAIELNPLSIAHQGRPTTAAYVAVLIEHESAHAAGLDESWAARAAGVAVLWLLDQRRIKLSLAEALLQTEGGVGLTIQDYGPEMKRCKFASCRNHEANLKDEILGAMNSHDLLCPDPSLHQK